MTANFPPPGLIGVCPTGGEGGKLIEIGQFLNGDGFKDWEHAIISIGGGLIVQAQPGGANVGHVSDHRVIHWCYGIYSLGTAYQLARTEDIAKGFARERIGYSPEDYFAIAAHRLHIPVPGLREYIASTGHMICSQLVDECYKEAGIHIFTDDRWPGYVTPLALYDRDLELGSQSRLLRYP